MRDCFREVAFLKIQVGKARMCLRERRIKFENLLILFARRIVPPSKAVRVTEATSFD